MPTRNPSLPRGFTLIEILVVIGILSIVGTVIGGILIASFRSYNKSDVLRNIEQQGNYVLDLVTRRLKNARIVELTGCNQIDITTFSGTRESFTIVAATSTVNGHVLYNNSDHGGGSPITNSSWDENGVNVLFSPGVCTGSLSSHFAVDTGVTPNRVTIQLVIEQSASLPEKVDYEASLTFKTTLSLRNY